MRYIPHTRQDIEDMLRAIGADSIEDLFACIPKELRLGETPLELPRALSETELTAYLSRMQKRNPDPERVSVFLGAGAYRHFSPRPHRPPDLTGGIFHQLHALPAGGEPGHAAGYL